MEDVVLRSNQSEGISDAELLEALQRTINSVECIILQNTFGTLININYKILYLNRR